MAGTSSQSLALSFVLSERRKGSVAVTVEANDDPNRFGMDLIITDHPSEDFLGFPACHATVKSTGGKGYASMYGWVQLFRCGTSALSDSDKWEMDPIPITSDLNTPFVWFGPEPSLFDMPFRPRDQEVDWICHSFLTGVSDCLLSKDVRPLIGFEWGFKTSSRTITIKPLQELELTAWDGHLELFRNRFPGWMFHSS